MRAQFATCPDCKSRLGLTLLGPFEVRFTLQVPVHHCRADTMHDAIFGKAEDFLAAIVKATEKDVSLHRIAILARLAQYALEAKKPHGR